MAGVNPIPEGYERLVAHLVVDGCSEAIAWYQKAFGAEEICRNPAPDGKRIMHAEVRIGESIVMLCDEFPEFCGGKLRNPKAVGGTTVTLHRFVEDADAAINRAREAGATVIMEPADMFWGDRYGTITDPFGHQWSFSTRQKNLTPEEIDKAAKAFFAG